MELGQKPSEETIIVPAFPIDLRKTVDEKIAAGKTKDDVIDFLIDLVLSSTNENSKMFLEWNKMHGENMALRLNYKEACERYEQACERIRYLTDK